MTEDQTIKKNFTITMDILSSDPLTSLLKVFQDGRPIEDYVEEFLNVSYRAPWKESTLKTIFWGGLDDHIYQQMPASDITCSQERYIEYALWLSGSSFTVVEVADDPVDKTVSPKSPTTATKASLIPTSTSTYLQAKLYRKLNSTLCHSCSRSTLNQRIESILVSESTPVSYLQFCGESLLRLPFSPNAHSGIPYRPSTQFRTKPTDDSFATPAGHCTVSLASRR